MRGLIRLLTLAALAVGLSLAARYNDGYVLFVLPPWRLEVSMNLMALLATLGFLIAYLLVRAAVNALSLPEKVRKFRARRAREKADIGLRDAMRLLQEGRYGHAIKSAERVYDSGHVKDFAALIALRAAHALRNETHEAIWRERARQQEGHLTAARLMTEAELALEARDYDAARRALDRLAASEGRHIAALRLSLRAQQGLGNWADVLRITRQLEKHRGLTAEQAGPLRARAHRELIERTTTADQLSRYWAEMPAADRLDPQLVEQAVRSLMAFGDCADAARMIEDHLDERWESNVVAHYADCLGGDTLTRIARAEKWLESHACDEQLLLVLGRLCRRQQLWGKAQSYLEASLAVRPTRAAHIELAQLLDQLERSGEADRHYRQAATL